VLLLGLTSSTRTSTRLGFFVEASDRRGACRLSAPVQLPEQQPEDRRKDAADHDSRKQLLKVLLPGTSPLTGQEIVPVFFRILRFAKQRHRLEHSNGTALVRRPSPPWQQFRWNTVRTCVLPVARRSASKTNGPPERRTCIPPRPRRISPRATRWIPAEALRANPTACGRNLPRLRNHPGGDYWNPD